MSDRHTKQLLRLHLGLNPTSITKQTKQTFMSIQCDHGLLYLAAYPETGSPQEIELLQKLASALGKPNPQPVTTLQANYPLLMLTNDTGKIFEFKTDRPCHVMPHPTTLLTQTHLKKPAWCQCLAWLKTLTKITI
jgi:hypothetical protein